MLVAYKNVYHDGEREVMVVVSGVVESSVAATQV